MSQMELRIRALEARVRRDSVLLLLLSGALVGVIGGIFSFATGTTLIASIMAGCGVFVGATTFGLALIVAYRNA